MTKVLKLLGGGMLAAVLAAMLFANVAFAESPPNPPARFVGSVLVDGQAPAGGTLIEARIGSATCGATTVFMAGSEARYVVDSPPWTRAPTRTAASMARSSPSTSAARRPTRPEAGRTTSSTRST